MTIPPTILGIDPGVIGGWAVVTTDGALIAAGELPVTGAGAQKMVSAALFGGIIRLHKPSTAMVELVSAMPKQGVSSSFKFGRAAGVVEGVIGGANVPMEFVSAAKWKREFGLSSDKEASRQRAIHLWPSMASLFARKKDHGPAEAALIALYQVKRTGQ